MQTYAKRSLKEIAASVSDRHDSLQKDIADGAFSGIPRKTEIIRSFAEGLLAETGKLKQELYRIETFAKQLAP